MFRGIAGFAILLGVSGVTLSAAERPEPSNAVAKNRARALLSKDNNVQQKAIQQIIAERKTTASELSAIIADPDNHVYRPHSVLKAMQLLGELRALEGIDVLVTYIGFPFVDHPDAPPYPTTNVGIYRLGRPLEVALPAVPALINIGEPCIDAVIRKLGSTDHILEHAACTAVLKGLRQQPSVREKLQKEIPKVLPRRRFALENALKALDEEPVSTK